MQVRLVAGRVAVLVVTEMVITTLAHMAQLE
jgi:hypothetical protein